MCPYARTNQKLQENVDRVCCHVSEYEKDWVLQSDMLHIFLGENLKKLRNPAFKKDED